MYIHIPPLSPTICILHLPIRSLFFWKKAACLARIYKYINRYIQKYKLYFLRVNWYPPLPSTYIYISAIIILNYLIYKSLIHFHSIFIIIKIRERISKLCNLLLNNLFYTDLCFLSLYIRNIPTKWPPK